MQLDYTVASRKPYAVAIEAVSAAAAAHGFRVQFIHDVQATLAEKGFAREPLTIVEMCNASYAHDVLARDVKIGLMLPCPVMVYARLTSNGSYDDQDRAFPLRSVALLISSIAAL